MALFELVGNFVYMNNLINRILLSKLMLLNHPEDYLNIC